MKINRMAVVQGLNLEPVPGQLRYGCGMTDFEDFYDIAEFVNEKAYLGNQIVFGDYETGELMRPPLTTVKFDWKNWGESSAETMLQMIQEKPVSQIQVNPYEFIERESVR